MCLFIVLWLTGSNQTVRSSISGYFHDPRGYVSKLGADPANSDEGLKVSPETVNDVRNMLEQSMHQMPNFEKLKDNVKISVTGEGLRNRPDGECAVHVLCGGQRQPEYCRQKPAGRHWVRAGQDEEQAGH